MSTMNKNTSAFMKVIQYSFVAALFVILLSQPAFAMDAGNGTEPCFDPELDTLITAPKYNHTTGVLYLKISKQER